MAFVVSITAHEAAHGFAANALGDATARELGLVTLDPIPHIRRSPFGMVVIPILSFALNHWMIGWASTPHSYGWGAQNVKKSAMVSVAGPTANLLLLFISAATIRLGLTTGWFSMPDQLTLTSVVKGAGMGISSPAAVMVSIFFSLNLILFLFNLMPVPPLDGSGIVPALLGPSAGMRYTQMNMKPSYQLMGLLVAWALFNAIYSPVYHFMVGIVYLGYGA